MKEHWIGLDIGGTKCAIILAGLKQGIRILDKIQFKTCVENGFADVFSRICEAIDEIVRRNNTELTQVNAIGISCGGPLDSERGTILSPPNLPGWDNIPITRLLSEKYGVPVFLQNDANACALVEWKMGAGRGTKNMVFLTMGTGMGAGIIADGKLLHGARDMAGEVGHLRLSEDGPIGYGKAGSFEGFASGGGIDRQFQEYTQNAIKNGNPPQWVADGYTGAEINTKTLADYARMGNTDAISMIEKVGTMLGKGLAVIVDMLNPECIVIGSVFVRCEDILRKSTEQALREEAIGYSLEGIKVVPASTGENLGDLAGIMTALYGMGVEPELERSELKPSVKARYEALFTKYPALECCRESVMEAYSCIQNAFANGGKLLLVGNGGSCADCGHIVGELMKGFWLKRPLDEDQKATIKELTDSILPGAAELFQMGLPAIDLTGHAALSTAVQNDLNPIMAPAQQVIALGNKGDVLLGISTGGNAKNVLLAAATAKALGLKTIGLTGESGGKLKSVCDIAVCAPAKSPADVQEYHLPIYHALCAMLEEEFFGETMDCQ